MKKLVILFCFSFIFIINSVYSCPINPTEQLNFGPVPVTQSCVEMQNYQLYTQTAGTQLPTIIFESGLGDSSVTWDKVMPQVAKFANTFAYDRDSLGRSQPIPNYNQPRTAKERVSLLRNLLMKMQIAPPYILVGHSLGGLYMQLYAAEYPAEVKAVVLVDSATRDQTEFVLPPPDANYYWEAAGMEESVEQVKQAPPFPHVPLIILSSGQRGAAWIATQKKLLQLSPFSEIIITKQSGHFIPREQPDLVINALQKIIGMSS